MQFKVPQFLDIEDTIILGLTWTQFAYCLGAAGSTYIAFRVTDSNISGFFIAFIPVTLFLALAFVKINNRSFIFALQNGINFFLKNNLYLWQNKKTKVDSYEDIINNIQNRKIEEEKNKKESEKTRLTIKDIAESLNRQNISE